MNKKSCVYVIPFRINNWQLPLRVQTFFASDFSQSKSIDFALPTSEVLFSRKFEILESILKDNYSNIFIFSEILLAHKNSLKLLKEFDQISANQNRPIFHLTYSDESISIKELIKRIENIVRNKKFCMSIDELRRIII
tara:strand:- start:56 stop:469 length:414 start_codon:yes stop_codon:yes gene_type:complete